MPGSCPSITAAAADLPSSAKSCTGGTGRRLSIAFLGNEERLTETVEDCMKAVGKLMAEGQAGSSTVASQRATDDLMRKGQEQQTKQRSQ